MPRNFLHIDHEELTPSRAIQWQRPNFQPTFWSTAAFPNIELADLFTATMAPFVGQMTKLDENVSLVLIGRNQESEEDGETASVEAVKDSDHEQVDMEASLSAILDSNTTDRWRFFARAHLRSLGQRANLSANSWRSGGYF